MSRISHCEKPTGTSRVNGRIVIKMSVSIRSDMFHLRECTLRRLSKASRQRRSVSKEAICGERLRPRTEPDRLISPSLPYEVCADHIRDALEIANIIKLPAE